MKLEGEQGPEQEGTCLTSYRAQVSRRIEDSEMVKFERVDDCPGCERDRQQATMEKKEQGAPQEAAAVTQAHGRWNLVDLSWSC